MKDTTTQERLDEAKKSGLISDYDVEFFMSNLDKMEGANNGHATKRG